MDLGDVVTIRASGRTRFGRLVKITPTRYHVAWESPSSGTVRIKSVPAAYVTPVQDQAASKERNASLYERLGRQARKIMNRVHVYVIYRHPVGDREWKKTEILTSLRPETWAPLARNRGITLERKDAEFYTKHADPTFTYTLRHAGHKNG